MGEKFLITGALGCIGAWIVKRLVSEDVEIVVLDPSRSRHRLDQLVEEGQRNQIAVVAGDVTDLASLKNVFDEYRFTNVIHLAALQVPFCRADPSLGASVNVVGTVNMFESVRNSSTVEAPLVYASSVATYDDVEDGSFGSAHPVGTSRTLYGVFKRANEGTASVYASENGVSSVGLRPYVVYGVGRDQGMTAEPTHAMLSAVLGRPHHISYGGNSQMQFADDVADAFIMASRSGLAGAQVFNLPGDRYSMEEVVDAIGLAVPGSLGRITYDEKPLPFPEQVDAAPFIDAIGTPRQTSIVDGVRLTTEMFANLVSDGRIKSLASSGD